MLPCRPASVSGMTAMYPLCALAWVKPPSRRHGQRARPCPWSTSSHTAVDTCPFGGPSPGECSRLLINWLRVLDTTERPQIDQGIGHQLHPIVSLLEAFKP